MTLDRGSKSPTPTTDILVEREARIAHYVKELSYLDGDPYAFGRRADFTGKLKEALDERNTFLWNQPIIRSMVEFFPELDNFGNAGLEPKCR